MRSAPIEPADDGWQPRCGLRRAVQPAPRGGRQPRRPALLRGRVRALAPALVLVRREARGQRPQTYKISYTPLLRQYRLTVGNVYQNFTRFEEVTRVLSRLRGWHVADKGALKKDQVYQAAVRMRLDTAQLPKPFQLNAIASRDWTLASDWHRWTITSMKALIFLCVVTGAALVYLMSEASSNTALFAQNYPLLLYLGGGLALGLMVLIGYQLLRAAPQAARARVRLQAHAAPDGGVRADGADPGRPGVRDLVPVPAALDRIVVRRARRRVAEGRPASSRAARSRTR